MRRSNDATDGEASGVGSGRSCGVVGLRVEGTREQNPLESAPAGCSKGQRAVEDCMHVGAVPARLRCAVPANDRVVASNKDGAPGMVRRSAAAVIKDEMDSESCAARLCEFAARGSRKGKEALGEDGPMAVTVDGAQRMAATPPVSEGAPSYVTSRPRSRG